MLNKWFQRQQTVKLEEALGALEFAPKTDLTGKNPDVHAVFVTAEGQVRAISCYPSFDRATHAYHQKIKELEDALSSQDETSCQHERHNPCYYGEGMTSFWSMTETSEFGAREIVLTLFAISGEQDRKTYAQLMRNHEQGQRRTKPQPKSALTLIKS